MVGRLSGGFDPCCLRSEWIEGYHRFESRESLQLFQRGLPVEAGHCAVVVVKIQKSDQLADKFGNSRQPMGTSGLMDKREMIEDRKKIVLRTVCDKNVKDALRFEMIGEPLDWREKGVYPERCHSRRPDPGNAERDSSLNEFKEICRRGK